MDTIPELEHLALRILEEYDEEGGRYVARCLETGAVVTAPNAEPLRALIEENIRLEISLALKSGNFGNLWRQQAPPDVWVRWHRAAGSGQATDFKMPLNLTTGTIPRREVKSEIQITKASISRTA